MAISDLRSLREGAGHVRPQQATVPPAYVDWLAHIGMQLPEFSRGRKILIPTVAILARRMQPFA